VRTDWKIGCSAAEKIEARALRESVSGATMAAMIVTIDGTAGSGKSTAARKLAARLGIAYLDTGAMYRALAYHLLQREIPMDDRAAMIEAARRVRLDVDCGPTHTRVGIDGRDVTETIRTMAVTRAATAVAAVQPIRGLLVECQRTIGRQLGSFVAEGRDQGTVVFPDANVKFVFEAAAERRAQRRLDELHADGEEVTYDEVLADVRLRDQRDAVQWQPLLADGAAIRIDTTRMTIAQVVDALEAHVEQAAGDRA